MFRMAVAALLLPRTDGVDPVAASLIALCHDLPEALVGDIPPQAPISRDEKHRLEAGALATMMRALGDHPASAWVHVKCADSATLQYGGCEDSHPGVACATAYPRNSSRRRPNSRLVSAVRRCLHSIGARSEGH
jgi:hypothetical protein